MVQTEKQMFYTRSDGKTVAVYAKDRNQAREKFKALDYSIDTAIISLDEWLSH